MPPKERPGPDKSLPEVVAELGLYPIEAFQFVRQGLVWTVEQIHGADPAPAQPPGPRRPRGAAPPSPSRHISGQQLCQGLRQYAIHQWGMLAGDVLARWSLRETLDFGRIVFAMVEAGHMHKTDNDTLADFRDVFSFDRAFDTKAYTIGSPK